MSLNNVERVLWEFGNDPAKIVRFTADPDTYLADYLLTDEERQALRNVDMKWLADRGVNTLLTVMVWPMLKGPEGMPFSYLEHMNGGKLPAGTD